MGKLFRNGNQYAGTIDSAAKIKYDNTTSGLQSKYVQSALDEIDKNLDTFKDDLKYVQQDVSKLSEQIADQVVPNYVVAEAEDVLSRIIDAQKNRTFNVAFITDLHNNGDASDAQITHACQGISYIVERIKLDAFCCLGDNTDNMGTTDLADCLKDIKNCNKHKHKLMSFTDLFELMGNHDFIELRSPKTNKLISSYNTNVVWGNKTGGYFHKDYEDYKVRVIGVNTSETSDVGVSVEQYNWFIETLDLSLKEEADKWQILILSHIPLDWHSFTVFSYVLNAYVNGTSWTDGTYNCDYANKNKAKIIANVHGHIHNLLVDKMYLGNYTVSSDRINVWRIAIPEVTELYSNHYDAPWKHDTTYWKIADTAEDTSFNVLCIDLDNRKIDAICYGAGIDRTINYTVFDDTGDDSGNDNNGYTNVIDTVGYTDDVRLSTSSAGTTKTATGMTTTGVIDFSAITKPVTIRTDGVDFSDSNSAATVYDSEGNAKYAMYISNLMAGSYGGVTAELDEDNNLTLVIGASVGSSWSSIQLCGYGSGENLIVTINEEIK